MAEYVLKRGDLYPVGTLVRVYALSQPLSPIPPAGAPAGAVVAEATVAGTSSVTFTGLTQGYYYVAWANVGGVDRYVRFHLNTPAEEGLEAALAAETARAEAAEALRAPLASPALTGTPTAPTQNEGDSSARLSTTAYADRAAEEAREDAEGASIPLTQKGTASGVASLDGTGIGAQPPAHHAPTHAEGGTDPLTIGDLPGPVVSSSDGLTPAKVDPSTKVDGAIYTYSTAAGKTLGIPAKNRVNAMDPSLPNGGMKFDAPATPTVGSVETEGHEDSEALQGAINRLEELGGGVLEVPIGRTAHIGDARTIEVPREVPIYIRGVPGVGGGNYKPATTFPGTVFRRVSGSLGEGVPMLAAKGEAGTGRVPLGLDGIAFHGGGKRAPCLKIDSLGGVEWSKVGIGYTAGEGLWLPNCANAFMAMLYLNNCGYGAEHPALKFDSDVGHGSAFNTATMLINGLQIEGCYGTELLFTGSVADGAACTDVQIHGLKTEQGAYGIKGKTESGSKNITLIEWTGLSSWAVSVGMTVIGAGIPTGTTIASIGEIGSNVIELSQAATATATGVSLILGASWPFVNLEYAQGVKLISPRFSMPEGRDSLFVKQSGTSAGEWNEIVAATLATQGTHSNPNAYMVEHGVGKLAFIGGSYTGTTPATAYFRIGATVPALGHRSGTFALPEAGSRFSDARLSSPSKTAMNARLLRALPAAGGIAEEVIEGFPTYPFRHGFTDELQLFAVRVPGDAAPGVGVTLYVSWFALAGGGGNVKWELLAQHFAEGGAMSAAAAAVTTVTANPALATARVTSVLANAFGCQPNDLVKLTLKRLGSSGEDTKAASVYVVEASLGYTTTMESER